MERNKRTLYHTCDLHSLSKGRKSLHSLSPSDLSMNRIRCDAPLSSLNGPKSNRISKTKDGPLEDVFFIKCGPPRCRSWKIAVERPSINRSSQFMGDLNGSAIDRRIDIISAYFSRPLLWETPSRPNLWEQNSDKWAKRRHLLNYDRSLSCHDTLKKWGAHTTRSALQLKTPTLAQWLF